MSRNALSLRTTSLRSLNPASRPSIVKLRHLPCDASTQSETWTKSCQWQNGAAHTFWTLYVVHLSRQLAFHCGRWPPVGGNMEAAGASVKRPRTSALAQGPSEQCLGSRPSGMTSPAAHYKELCPRRNQPAGATLPLVEGMRPWNFGGKLTEATIPWSPVKFRRGQRWPAQTAPSPLKGPCSTLARKIYHANALQPYSTLATDRLGATCATHLNFHRTHKVWRLSRN